MPTIIRFFMSRFTFLAVLQLVGGNLRGKFERIPALFISWFDAKIKYDRLESDERKETRMNLEGHVETLDYKHHKLEEKILKESQRPYPDQYKIAKLKKEKLRIKDELALLMAH